MGAGGWLGLGLLSCWAGSPCCAQGGLWWTRPGSEAPALARPGSCGCAGGRCVGSRVSTETFPGPGVATFTVRVFVVLGRVWGPPAIGGSCAPLDRQSS